MTNIDDIVHYNMIMKVLIVSRVFVIMFFCLGLVISITIGCSESSDNNSSQSPHKSDSQAESKIEIQYPTGTLLPESILESKVPTLFNLGKLTDNVYGMLLGPSLPTNKQYNYEPIGVYTLVKDSTELSFILCKSDQLDEKLIDADNYNSWSLNEIQYKNLIASWFKTNCELNNCSKMEWANDLKALRILENVK